MQVIKVDMEEIEREKRRKSIVNSTPTLLYRPKTYTQRSGKSDDGDLVVSEM